ncbi:MAG TPA: chromate transporter [Acidimicrobiia bacterium]|nr:chromate transporter [Acidimicrobiia bacterium]
MVPPRDEYVTVPSASYRLAELARYFLYLGAAGFGGPVALVEYMHRDLVDRREWITDDEYREGLALANLSPGPLAAQLAIYLGFVHYRYIGASLVAVAFVLPSFLMVIGIGWAYQRFGGLPAMQAVFYGVGAAIIGIIAWSAHRLTRKTIKGDPLLWIIFFVMAAITAITETERVELFPLAGLVVWAARSLRLRGQDQGTTAAFLLPISLAVETTAGGTAPTSGLTDIFWFFLKAGALVFGSGLAIVPFLYGGVVGGYGWLDAQQFLDAVAVAMITPGPVVITTGFIGYLVAGFPGAIVAAIATFLPAYLFTVLPAPYFRKYGRRPSLAAIADGVTAAAIGAITGAVIVLGRHAIIDVPTLILASTALLILWKSPRRIPEPVIVAGAAVAGLILYPIVTG